MCWSKEGDHKVVEKFACRKCEGNIENAVEQEEKLCDEVKTLREFTYLGDLVSAGGGYEAAVIARTTCGRVKLRELFFYMEWGFFYS